MKKLFLILVFTFATVSISNAKVEGSVECFETADLGLAMAEAYYEAAGLSFNDEQLHNVWLAFYDTCMG